MKKVLCMLLTVVVIFSQSNLGYCAETNEGNDIMSTEIIAQHEYVINDDIKLNISNNEEISVGDDVVVTAELNDVSKNYEYCFLLLESGVEVLQDFSPSNLCTYKAEMEGDYIIRVILRDDLGNLSMQESTYSVIRETLEVDENINQGTVNDSEKEDSDSDTNTISSENEIVEDTPRPVEDGLNIEDINNSLDDDSDKNNLDKAEFDYLNLILSINANKTGDLATGSSVLLTATAKGGDGEYEYRFTETYNGVSTTVQNYSEKNTYEYKAKGEGIHKFTVSVRDGSGNAMSGTYLLFVVSVESLRLVVSSDRTPVIEEGTSLTLVANAYGGYGEYEYRFTETFNGVAETVQNYSSTNTYLFCAENPGEYKYTVAVKDKMGQIMSASYTIKVEKDFGLKGIDVSAYQGNINWSKVKDSGVDFAMIRILSGKMGGLSVDPYFYSNIKGAKQNGIKVGVYRYGYAMTVEEARKEANMVVDTLKKSGYDLDYPVAYDVEDQATQGTLSKSELTAVIKAFQEVIEDNGYQFMIYANLNWLNNIIQMEEFEDVDVWIARYRDYTPELGHGYTGPGNVTIWQYSDQGSVPGISGYVDMNIGYYDY